MIRLICLCVFMFSLIIAPAEAKNWEVRSENFILVTDDRQDSAEKIVADLEEYRKVILGLWVTTPSREVQPIRIYAFNNSKTFEKVTGRPSKGIGGLYKSKREGPIFVLNWNGGSGDERVKQKALHEYTHHLLSQYSDKVYPKWYIEGFCEYLSTLTKRDNQTYVLGHPVLSRLNHLNARSWSPMSEILGAVKSYPFVLEDKKDRNFISKFYAQSWLSVAYIHSRPELTSQTPAYLELITSGIPALQAFEQAYGLTPEEFDVPIKDFFKIGAYPSTNIKLSKPVRAAAPMARELNKEEYALRIADAMNHYLSYGKFLPEKLAQYEKAESLLGKTPDIISGKALVFAKMKKYDSAIALADKGLSESPAHSTLNQVKGHTLYRKSISKKPIDKEMMHSARTHFKAAMVANPENMMAHYQYVRTFSRLNDEPNKQAVASAKYVLSYYKSKNFIHGNLGPAEVLMSSGDYGEAKAAIEKALLWSLNEKTVEQASKLKEQLNSETTKK